MGQSARGLEALDVVGARKLEVWQKVLKHWNCLRTGGLMTGNMGRSAEG